MKLDMDFVIENTAQYTKNIKIFSFCIYGQHKKYCQGLLENIKIISKEYPEFKIWIYGGDDVPEKYIKQYKEYEQVNYIQVNQNSDILMCCRFLPIDHEKVILCLVRDADSRITKRDIWCINQFINNKHNFHTIRDHYFHKTRIMGGLFGMKKCKLSEQINFRETLNIWIQNKNIGYNTDADFLTENIHGLVKTELLIHSDIIGYNGEDICTIDLPHDDDYDFIGNVYNFDTNDNEIPEFKHDHHLLLNHLNWLDTQKRYDIIFFISCKLDISKLVCPSDQLHSILTLFYIASYKLTNPLGCQKLLELFRYTYVEEHDIVNSNYLFNILGKKKIGTTDPERKPKDNEIVICYGNYCNDVNNLPFSSNVYRNALYYNMITHDDFEYDECWKNVDKIYIINLIERKDRYIELLSELARMNAPLHKIYHVKGEKTNTTGDKTLDSYLGATESHLRAVRDMKNNNYNNCIIFEDDFTFNFNYQEHKNNMKLFFERRYEYDVCLLAASKYHKIVPYDDLLSLSYQICTTTSGYMISNESIDKVLECFEDGYNKMLLTKDYTTFVCDRYWSKLQKNNKFFIFNKKMGYQRVTYSDIKKSVNFNFD